MGIQKSQLYKAGIKINDQETNICENMNNKKMVAVERKENKGMEYSMNRDYQMVLVKKKPERYVCVSLHTLCLYLCKTK